MLLRSSSFSKKNWSSSILNFFQVVFHFQKKLRLSSTFKSFEVIFHFQFFWGRLPFTKCLKSSSIFKFFDLVFYFKHFLGRFPFLIFLRSSCIFKSFEVVFHISYSLVRIRLHKRISGGGFSIDNIGIVLCIYSTGVYILQKYKFYSLHLDKRYKFSF